MTDPQISIIMKSRNLPEFIEKAVDSVIAQTRKDWELIIIDDDSRNPQLTAAFERMKADSRIRIYRTSMNTNRDVGLLWNMALDKMRGKYWCILDDDNTKLPTFIERMAGYLDGHPQKMGVICFNQLMNADAQVVGIHSWKPEDVSFPRNVAQNQVDSGEMMLRKEVIDKIGWFDERLNTCEDWDFVNRLLAEIPDCFGYIHEPLAQYRWHGKNSSSIAPQLGLEKDLAFIRSKKYERPINVVLTYAKREITSSQQAVLSGIYHALATMPHVQLWFCPVTELIVNEADYIIVFMPFRLSQEEVQRIAGFKGEKIYLMCEDPQILNVNLERARYADIVVTNDRSAIQSYKTLDNKPVVYYSPCLLIDDVQVEMPSAGERDYDVMFLGYPYESRKQLIREIAPDLRRYNCFLIGDEWEKEKTGIPTMKTMRPENTMKWLARTKIVLLSHRTNTDLGGSEQSVKPESVARGYFELGSGACVMLDNSRPHHCFRKNEVLFYSDPADLVGKIKSYLENYPLVDYPTLEEKYRAWREFTYRNVMHRLLNGIRSRRMNEWEAL